MTGTYTKEEMREMFLAHCQSIAFYWSQLEDKTPRERCDGVVFSMLNIFDGCSGGFPCGINLVMDPHPEGKDSTSLNGEYWVEPGQVINDDVMLHELFVKPLRKMNESTPKPTDNLSPAAQAVLHEFWNAPISPARNVQIAAAIRALADQVAPELIGDSPRWPRGRDATSHRLAIRARILTIATELEGPMADLSPAAQAVVNKIAASDCIDRGGVYYRQVATVTIRAVADMVVPLELCLPEQAPIDRHIMQDQRSKTRHELLAIAAELDGSNG